MRPPLMRRRRRQCALKRGLVIALLAFVLPGTAPGKEFEEQRRATLRYEVINTTGSVVTDGALWLFAPPGGTAAQRCCASLTVSHPHDLRTDYLGNRIVRVMLPFLAPYGRTAVRIAVVLGGSTKGAAPSADRMAELLAPQPFVESDHATIRDRAKRFAGNSAMTTARRLQDWVSSYVSDTGYARRERGALHAMNQGTGDCTEFTYLYTALARASGIPTRIVEGYLHEGDGPVSPAASHDWAESFIDGRWIIVDPHQGRFDADGDGYVATRIVGSDAATTTYPGHRFWHTGNGLVVRMK